MERKQGKISRRQTLTLGLLVVGLACLMVFGVPTFAQQSDFESGTQYRDKTGGSRDTRYGTQGRDDGRQYRDDREYRWDEDRDFDSGLRYRDQGGGSRDSRISPGDRESDYRSRSDREYGRRTDRGYQSGIDYRERYGGSRDYRYGTRSDRDRGGDQGDDWNWSSRGADTDFKSGTQYRENTGGSRESRYGTAQRDRDWQWQRDRDRYRTRRPDTFDYGIDYRERVGGARESRYGTARQERDWQWQRDRDRYRTRRPDEFDYGIDYRERVGGSREKRMGVPGFSGRGYFEERKPQSRRSPGRVDRIEGKIREMNTVTLTGLDEKHVVVRLDTDNDRTAKVDLGPEKRFSNLELEKGDTVVILGTPGTINDRSMLMAHWVEIGDKRYTIKRPQDMNLTRYTGEIIKTKKTRFGDETPEHLMARIRLDDGSTTIVNMGPEKELRNALEIEEGKTFSMLARPVNINGKRALVAEVLNVGDRTVDIDWAGSKAKRSAQ